MDVDALRPLLLGFTAVMGLAVGSFLNVVIARVPQGESIVSPPSACPKCGHALSWFENVPVISWVVLRAKCRGCGQPISAVYPAVELATAVMFVVTALLVGFTATLVPYLWFAAVTVALFVIDMQTYRLPNPIVYPSVLVALVGLPVARMIDGEGFTPRIWFGALIYGGFLLVVHLIKPAAMGFGDVKLSPALGAYLTAISWGALPVGILAAFFAGSVFGLAVMAARGFTHGTRVPFGPGLLIGTWLAIAFGNPIAAWYAALLM